MAHTEGEWGLSGNYLAVVSCLPHTYIEIAKMSYKKWMEDNSYPMDYETAKDNARLIAAAPDLLAALQGDEENCVPNIQTILSQALLGNNEAVKSMLRELCSIHAATIAKAKGVK